MNTLRTTCLTIAIAGTIVAAHAAPAQAPKPMKEEKPGLIARTKVTPAAARATALARVKGSTISEEELEEEGGKLVYSFDLKVAGKSGVEEVLVDAITGAVVSVEHETPAGEAAEAAKEKAKKPPVKKPGSDRD